MRVAVLWMVMLGLSVEEVTDCSDESVTNLTEPTRVPISCPFMANSSELTYRLLFNDNYVCQIRLDKNHNSATFEIQASEDGVFTCMREVFLPPPFKKDCHRKKVKLAENKSLPVLNASAPDGCTDRSPLVPEVVMWAGGGVMLLYSLIITSITIHLWRKQKRDNEDINVNVYTNVRPTEQRKASNLLK